LPRARRDHDNEDAAGLKGNDGWKGSLRVYTDPASERHVNLLAGVEDPERFPAALAGAASAERDGAPVEWCACSPAQEDVLAAVHAPAYLDHLKALSARGAGLLHRAPPGPPRREGDRDGVLPAQPRRGRRRARPLARGRAGSHP